ncbi:MAG: MATE family efflux transporter [Candidatus Marinimicrobia bacterium]|nr:MATE family efflux transporter [Candidatus Neomarinimicrobiota bacterium]
MKNPPKESRLQDFLDNPPKALWRLALPMMAGMGIQTVYMLVDMMFIGRISGEAIAAVAFVMPLMFLVFGMTMGLGSGVTASIARFIGKEDKQSADNSAEHALALGGILSLILVSTGLLYGQDMIALLGAPQSITVLSWPYLKVITFGLPFMIYSMFFRSILSGEGDMKLPMIVAGFGTVLNIILDPIFIFSLNMGVRGAAVATVFSQIFVLIIFVYMLFVKEHTYIRFKMRDFSPSLRIIKDIMVVGIPASISMVVMAVGGGVFNKILVHYSTDAVAAYQIGSRIDHIIFLPIMAIATAITTLVGMFYGAGEIEKVKLVVKYAITRCIFITFISSGLVFIFAPLIVAGFTTNENINEIAVTFLRLITLVYPIVPIGMTSGRVLQGLGRGLPMLVLTVIRVVGVSAPLALIFTFVFDKPVEWVWYSMMFSITISVSTALTWLRFTYRKIEKSASLDTTNISDISLSTAPFN